MKFLYLISLFFILCTTGICQVKETILTNHSASDRYANYSPDGKLIVFESDRNGSWDIYLMNSDGKSVKRLTLHDKDDRRPSWHPSGKSILFESDRMGQFELFKMDIPSGRVDWIDIKRPDGDPIFARYSPDGSKIAFSFKESDDKANIAIVNKKGKGFKLVTDNDFRSFYPSWSPDGKSIVFFSRHETNNNDDEIYTINLDGTGMTRLTNWPKHNFCPSWSSDGAKIAYVTSMDDRRPEIYIMDADGQNAMRITNNEDGDTLPFWSKDSKKLLITGYRNGSFEICELLIN